MDSVFLFSNLTQVVFRKDSQLQIPKECFHFSALLPGNISHECWITLALCATRCVSAHVSKAVILWLQRGLKRCFSMIIVDVIMVVGVHCYVAKEYICSFSYNFWFSIISSSRKPAKGVATLKALRTRSFFCWSWKFADVSRFLSFSWQYQSFESTRDADDDLYSRNSLSVPIKLIFAYAQLSSFTIKN